MAGNQYQAVDGSGDLLGDVAGDLEEQLNDVPEWEGDLKRTLRQILDDNQGWIEDLDGKIVYDPEEGD